MSITTKKGDKGKTSLLGERSVDKDDLRIEICGCLDELSSFLGLSKSLIRSKKIKSVVDIIQKDLIMIAAEIISAKNYLPRLLKRINKDRVVFLDDEIYRFEKKKILKTRSFHLAGDNPISSSFDISRAFCRTLERKIVTFKKRKKLKNAYILVYLNRLSDLLYLLARSYDKKNSKNSL